MHRHVISFKNAFNGLLWALKTQPNFRVHVFVTAFVSIAAIYFRIGWEKYLLILVMIVFVLTAELLNTSLEAATDAHKVIKKTVEEDQFIGIAKDVAAAAVLVAAMGAVVVGAVIFLPYILGLLK